jgi:bacterioferritin-associated ferredoxin
MATPAICGICGRTPKQNEDDGLKIRLTDADMVDQEYPESKAAGLYSCCGKCHKKYLKIVAARMGKTPEEMAYQAEW